MAGHGERWAAVRIDVVGVWIGRRRTLEIASAGDRLMALGRAFSVVVRGLPHYLGPARCAPGGSARRRDAVVPRPATHHVDTVIPVGPLPSSQAFLGEVAVSPITGDVYVTTGLGDSLVVIS
jgi:hypothetical protein